MKITLIGNCQTFALTWYLGQLNSNFDTKWVEFSPKFRKTLTNAMLLKSKKQGKIVPVIINTDSAIKRFNESDYVIFQHLKPQTSKKYHFNALKDYAKDSKLISISSIWYEPDDPDEKMLKGMKERASKSNIDIPAHKIIEKHGSKVTMQQNNHPHAFYFLELVRELCILTGWDYYSDEQYNQYLKEGYPFG